MSTGLRSLDFNWNFAPTLDVNNDPANPVIGERSFSDNPHTVARLAAAWIRCASREGVACCIKHFPGHGDTSVDSHVDWSMVSKTRSALDALELLPFRLLQQAAPAIMTAHIVFPLLDPPYPATLTRTLSATPKTTASVAR
jgi:beta-N-acetylhexosaminidase